MLHGINFERESPNTFTLMSAHRLGLKVSLQFYVSLSVSEQMRQFDYPLVCLIDFLAHPNIDQSLKYHLYVSGEVKSIIVLPDRQAHIQASQ